MINNLYMINENFSKINSDWGLFIDLENDNLEKTQPKHIKSTYVSPLNKKRLSQVNYIYTIYEHKFHNSEFIFHENDDMIRIKNMLKEMQNNKKNEEYLKNEE